MRTEGAEAEILDPHEAAEPSEWSEFCRKEGLTAVWSYEVFREVARGTWAPALAAVLRDAGQVCGIVCAVYFGVRRPGSTRPPHPRRGPLLVDVRHPGDGHGPFWRFAADVPADRRRALLRAYEKAVARYLGWGCVGVIHRCVPDDDIPLITRGGALQRRTFSGTIMPIEWDSVDGWLASLSKSRRTDLRRQHRMVEADSDITVRMGSARTDLDPTVLTEMHTAHAQRLASRFDPRPPLPLGYFTELIRRPDVTILSYTDGAGRLLAFGTLLDAPVTAQVGQWAALRPDEGGRKHLYFDHYVRLIGQVIKNGRPSLLGGRGMVDVKQSLGFRPVPMRMVAVPRVLLGR